MRFDKVTIEKILKSLYKALLPTCGIAAIGILESIDFSESAYAAIGAYIIMILINAIKEFIKGEPSIDIHKVINEK